MSIATHDVQGRGPGWPLLPAAALALAKAIGQALDQGRPLADMPGALRQALADVPPVPAIDASAALRKAAGLWTKSALRPERSVMAWMTAPDPVAQRLRSSPDLAWLMLHDGDGFRRQAALAALPGLPQGPLELAALFHRLNDWVPQVRQRAEDWFAHHTGLIDPDLAAQTLLALLPRTAMFARWSGRGEQVANALLARPDVLAALALALLRARPGRVGPALDRILAQPGFDRHLPALAQGAAQPSVRGRAMVALLSSEVRWVTGLTRAWTDKSAGEARWTDAVEIRALTLAPDRLALLDHAAADRAAALRKIAADHLPRLAPLDPDRVRALAGRLARDPNAAVRMRADWWLRQDGQASPSWH